MSTHPSPATQREALDQSEKKANEQQPGSYKDEETDEQGGRDSADRAGQEADPRPRLVAIEKRARRCSERRSPARYSSSDQT